MSRKKCDNLFINLKSNDILNGKYLVIQPIAKYYKEVFLCKQLDTDEEVVIKVEKIGSYRKSRLEMEISFCRQLCFGNGFLKVLDDFVDANNRYMVMNKLGDNLEQIFYTMRKTGDKSENFEKLLLKSVVRYADEMISRVCNCHVRNIVHRDIKPENFVVDLSDKSMLYLIDFNLAKIYSTNEGHIEYASRSPKYSVGNVMFLSINAHLGDEQSRRDDMLSLGYSLIYLAKGSLPWSDIRGKKKTRLEHMEQVLKVKQHYPIEELCQDLPKQFFSYMVYCKQLRFEEQPNYTYLRTLFRDLFVELDTETESPTVADSIDEQSVWHSNCLFETESLTVTDSNVEQRLSDDNCFANNSSNNNEENSSNHIKNLYKRFMKKTETAIFCS